MKQVLNPTLDDLKLKSVLMQAWRKASKYIRLHNWYSDTLELDYQSLRLPLFLSEIQERLDDAPAWKPGLLRAVPSPKSQKWKLVGAGEQEEWIPVDNIQDKIRPLAHVSLIDQVVATAIMMCMADRIETLQGDSTLSILEADHRAKIISYGNRLLCDNLDGTLRHRWGSNKLYRQYFTDYKTFLQRPSVVADELNSDREHEVAIVQCDLSKFYDRVRPELLMSKVRKYFAEETGSQWFEFLGQFFAWHWQDTKWIERYAVGDRKSPVEGFNTVALPQGLVASGFFANVVLLDIDRALVGTFGRDISDRSGFVIQDICRYVDDMRLVITVPVGTDEAVLQETVTNWLQGLLNRHAVGLVIKKDKTKVTIENRERRFLVPQSKAANRIQKDVSGTFDMLHGTELLGAIEGFFYTQKRYSQADEKESERAGLLVGIADIRDDTAARFAAGRFRQVFRSLRPILEDENDFVPRTPESDINHEDEDEDTEAFSSAKLVLSQKQLDERGQLFAAMLIEEWVTDPSNVRLLRIALDFYPDSEFLDRILNILKDGWQVGGCQSRRKEVKQYCLAELFRAGATETGMVTDHECLPSGLDLDKYHTRLTEEAKGIIDQFSSRRSAGNRLSWYLMQQAYLYLAARKETESISLPSRRSNKMLALYQNFIGYLNGEHQFNVSRRCTFSALAVTALGNSEILASQKLSSQFIQQLCLTAPSVAIEYWTLMKDRARPSDHEMARRMGLEPGKPQSLPEIARGVPNPFWDEENLLTLGAVVADHLINGELQSPWQIQCQYRMQPKNQEYEIPRVESASIYRESSIASELFVAPDWTEDDDEVKKFKLGMILRFALRGNIDFYSSRRLPKQTS